MHILILFLGICIFAVVAHSDIRTRRIPNELVVGLLALAAFRIALDGDPVGAVRTLAAGAALFGATFLLFWRGLIGGGDVKLMVATSFLIGYHDVLAYLFVMTMSGALMAVAILAGEKLRSRATAPPDMEIPEKRARLTVPYGVAISLAGIVTLLAQTLPSG